MVELRLKILCKNVQLFLNVLHALMVDLQKSYFVFQLLLYL